MIKAERYKCNIIMVFNEHAGIVSKIKVPVKTIQFIDFLDSVDPISIPQNDSFEHP